MNKQKKQFLMSAMLLAFAELAIGETPAGEYECILEPHVTANIGSPADGVLEKVLVDRGDRVSKGQLLARLTSGVEEANIEVTKARLKFSQVKVSRNEELANKSLIPEIDKDEMVMENKVNQVTLHRDEEVLKLRHIFSPLEGVVVERLLSAGEHVRQDRAQILKLAQVDPLNVEMVLPASMFGTIKVGMTANVLPDAPVGGEYQAKVVIVDSVVDAASGTFGVRLNLPNPGNKIPAGFKCKVRLSGLKAKQS
jgi:membrane fusion protein (multidrug efflux system)